jgi:hypothetical protein
MYVGFLLALSVLMPAAFAGRAYVSRVSVAFACVSAALWAVDGAANLFGLAATPGWGRFALGMLLAVSLSPFLAALFLGTFERPKSRQLRGGPAVSISLLAVGLAAALNAAPRAWALSVETYAAAAGLTVFLLVVHAALIGLVIGTARARLAAALAFVTVGVQVAALGFLRALAGI